MSNHTPDSFLPEKCRILSGSALKMIAMMTMLIDCDRIHLYFC